MPPQLVISKPSDDPEKKSEVANLAKRRAAGPQPDSKEQGRSTSSEWIDIDDPSPRRRRSSKRASRRDGAQSKSFTSSQIGRQTSESILRPFFPRLSSIVETSESVTSSRPSTRSSGHRRHRDRSPARRSRHRDESTASYRRPVRHRTGGVQRRGESLLKVNPSLLSVLSSLTGSSDKSSGSGSTITQQSYDRKGSDSSGTPTGRRRRVDSGIDPRMSTKCRPRSPNVFDYIQPSAVDDTHDSHSVASSAPSSHYEPSDAGSSEAPGTPSSRSTFPSPTTNRSQSVAELRMKYDPQYVTSPSSVRSNSHSPGLRKQPTVSDVPEANEEGSAAPPETIYGPMQRSSSRSSRTSRRSSDRLQRQEESIRQHMEYAQQHSNYVHPVYGLHRSGSASSHHSDRSAHAYHAAMQQYQWPPTPPDLAQPIPTQAMNGHIVHDRPPAPDAPDLNQRTVAGYEMVALELATSDSPVKPLYRKFEYLNHRILLHLQDELCELEEQLRIADEVIAQMATAIADGQTTPASRRGEVFSGSEVHARRTLLLGHIFTKTEQYNRAMSSYNSMVKDSRPADEDQIGAYQRWMAKHAPVHEVETRFLQQEKDLVVPGKGPGSIDRPTKHAALAYLPVALMLPLLLYSLIPTLTGRLVVTALIAVGAFIVTATTRI